MLRSGVRGGGVSGEQLGLCAIRHPLKASGEAYVLLCAHAAMGMDGPFSGRPHRMTTSWQACGRCRASGIIRLELGLSLLPAERVGDVHHA